MTNLYLVAFIGGLLLTVAVMIFGVERPRERHPAGERSFRPSPAPVGAFAVIFGLAGYVLTRNHVVSGSSAILLATVLGLMAGMFTIHLVRNWWSVTPEHEIEDERYLLQGHLARVTKAITVDVDGEVAFEVGHDHRVLRARNFESGSLSAGTDVVIERIEGEIAYVEAWQEVEKRL
jgi:membrane protein implicated in regulation of membrane protease activity